MSCFMQKYVDLVGVPLKYQLMQNPVDLNGVPPKPCLMRNPMELGGVPAKSCIMQNPEHTCIIRSIQNWIIWLKGMLPLDYVVKTVWKSGRSKWFMEKGHILKDFFSRLKQIFGFSFRNISKVNREKELLITCYLVNKFTDIGMAKFEVVSWST